MPKQLTELLKLASTLNGLQAPGLHPWHLKASYQTFDHAGDPEPAGTFEEFWVSPTNFKRSFTSPEFNESEFGTDHGLYRAGDQDWPGQAEFMLHGTLLEPIPAAVNSLGLHLKKKQVSVGTVKLQCLVLESPRAATAVGLYCFEAGRPMLRLAGSWDGRTQTEYNDIVMFQGRYIARDIRTNYRGELASTVRIDILEPLSAGQESNLGPPAGAKLIAEPVSLASSAAASLLVLQTLPEYPQEAKISGVQGTVLIDIVVGKDGAVQTAKVVNGPDDLREASLIAIRKWKYQPFPLLGLPLAFQAQVPIIFSLGP
jgi:TonB family protein